MAPKFIFDETQVGSSTLAKGTMNGLEILSQLGELSGEVRETFVGGLDGGDDCGDGCGDLRTFSVWS